MSQVLVTRVDRNKILLFQDLYFGKKKALVTTTVKEAVCTICENGLEEGVSVTGKKIGQKMRFFCQKHLPKDI